jgi:hypothetical protein
MVDGQGDQTRDVRPADFISQPKKLVLSLPAMPSKTKRSRVKPVKTQTAPATPLFSEPIFGEGGKVLPDPKGFLQPHPSDNATYAKIEALLDTQTCSFNASTVADGEVFSLADAFGPQGPAVVAAVQKQGQIVFHCAGDTGASAAGNYSNEVHVFDVVAADFQARSVPNQAAFFYHLGDIIYNFGEAKYYYDQFYEPLRNYPRPVFAIPGNHDSFILPNTPAGSDPLAIYSRNFCAPEVDVSPDAGSLHRTALTQPGVYWTLDAPFVRIIGLFSNALEDPGVISSEGGTWKNVPDLQLAYLTAQLTRIKQENYLGAVLLAVHHLPFCYAAPSSSGGGGGQHQSSTAMLRDIDTICQQVGVYPHAVLSGHSHNYQRFTRTIQLAKGTSYQVPFVVCGCGGHAVLPLVQNDYKHQHDPKQGANVSYLEQNPAVTSLGLTLDHFDDYNYGYLRVTVNAQQLVIQFNPTTSLGGLGVDTVTVDLATHQVLTPAGKSSRRTARPTKAKGKHR